MENTFQLNYHWDIYSLKSAGGFECLGLGLGSGMAKNDCWGYPWSGGQHPGDNTTELRSLAKSTIYLTVFLMYQISL